jgi:hypothetical protein
MYTLYIACSCPTNLSNQLQRLNRSVFFEFFIKKMVVTSIIDLSHITISPFPSSTGASNSCAFSLPNIGHPPTPFPDQAALPASCALLEHTLAPLVGAFLSPNLVKGVVLLNLSNHCTELMEL